MFVQRRLRRITGARRGGTAVTELAVSLPIIVSVMVGVIDVGQLMWVRQILHSAAREGARAFMNRTVNVTAASSTAEKFLALYFDSTSRPTFIAGNLGQITVLTNPSSNGVFQVQRVVTVRTTMGDILLTGNFLGLSPTRVVQGVSTFRCDQ